jgi:hypothetical protein
MSTQFTKNSLQKRRHPTVNLQKGFTLLLAALIASIVLSLGAAIFAIAQKELALSSIGRNSQFAFYAADTAAECALYWDVRGSFATSSDSHNPAASVACAQTNSTVTFVAVSQAATSTFTLSLAFNDPTKPYCANVSVAKSRSALTNGIVTVVRADGFSTGCTTISTDPQALQRSVELHY